MLKPSSFQPVNSWIYSFAQSVFVIRANHWLTSMLAEADMLKYFNNMISSLLATFSRSVRAANVSSFSSAMCEAGQGTFNHKFVDSKPVAVNKGVWCECTALWDKLERLPANWMTSSCFMKHCHCSNFVCHSEKKKKHVFVCSDKILLRTLL